MKSSLKALVASVSCCHGFEQAKERIGGDNNNSKDQGKYKRRGQARNSFSFSGFSIAATSLKGISGSVKISENYWKSESPYKRKITSSSNSEIKGKFGFPHK